MRPLWDLAEEGVFLNHGSYGACPRSVLAEQARIRQRMESQPDVFFRRGIMPDGGDTPLRAAARELGRFVNAPSGEVAFVENATLGIQAVLGSMDFGPGDRILITDHTYNAVRLMVDAKCADTGAVPVIARLPLDADADAVVAAILEAATPQVRLAIVDHITSPTAWVLPLERIIPDLQARGIPVAVDGAHGVGQVELDLAALAPDWYVANAHKWLFAPRGTAFLHASPRVAARTRPAVVSHFVGMGFPRAFDYVGTRDYSPWLATPAAIAFFHELGPEAARSYRQSLVRSASESMQRLGAIPVGGDTMCAAMRSFVLPQSRQSTPDDAAALLRGLWDRHRIQSQVVAFAGQLLLRISAQVYVDEGDIARLVEVLDRHGWPGRA